MADQHAGHAATLKADVPAGAWWNDAKVRGYAYQALAFAIVVLVTWWVINNTIQNLQRANIASGFGFLNGRAGFDLSESLIEFSSDSTYGRAFLAGILNTIFVAFTGIIAATIAGFLVGIGRLSRNFIIRGICTVYVEIFRNIPPLLVIFFWYIGVLAALPQVRQSLSLGPFGYLNNRGFFVTRPIWGEGAWLILAALVLAIVAIVVIRRWAWRRQLATGQQFPVLGTSLALFFGLPILAFLFTGMPVTFETPVVAGFNLKGGWQMKPEFIALYLALSLYTASFIAEIVRAGILGISKGQSEAAYALGFRHNLTLRLVIVPQALRIIIPPLTSQYLNLTKNTSLAIAVGYPDLVAVGGTILNQTGQSVEVVAIWMMVYLTLSLSTSLLMNWFNARVALVDR
jgi:general L-amino acid transport system permease protein